MGERLHRQGLGRVLPAAVALCTLLVPVVTVAGPKEDLKETRDRLQQVRRQLESNQSKAGTLKGQIRDLERDITRIQIALVRLDEDIAIIQSEVRDAEAQLEATQSRIHEIEDIASDQAVALYKTGDTDVLDVLLASETIAELDARVEMLGIAAEQNTGALIEYGRLKVSIEDQSRALFRKRDKLSKRMDARSLLLADMNERKGELDERYREAIGNVEHLKHEERGLAAASRDLQDDIIAAQAQRAVTSLGQSSKGYIWPLNGPVTSPYGSRWGGMHTGIDIDGVTGQPIVASKSGSVIMASYYSGYGNAVIIDHGGGYSTLYGHMSDFNVSGGSVRQGDVIGYVGCTGSCTGDHLHFEVRVGGNPVDPMPFLP